MERELFTALMRQAATIIEGQWRPSKASYTHLEVLAVVLWAAVHDRPISWACDRANWPCYEYRRRLPSGSTVSRRSRRPEMLDILTTLIASLRVRGEGERTLIVDGRPLTIAKHHNDPDAGFGRAAGGIGAGYKLHQIVDLLGNCRAFRVESLNASEPVVARAMLEELAEGEADVLLADAAYDCNKTYEAAGAKGVQMLAERRYKNATGVGHRRKSAWRLDALEIMEREPERLSPRRTIESCFGTQGNCVGGLGPLPNHVRRLHRVRLWVAAKLAIDAMHRWRRAAAKAA